MRLPENCQYSMGVSKNPRSTTSERRFIGQPSCIDDIPCNLTQFCYNDRGGGASEDFHLQNKRGGGAVKVLHLLKVGGTESVGVVLIRELEF